MGTVWWRLRCSRGRDKEAALELKGYKDSHQGCPSYRVANASASRYEVIFSHRVLARSAPWKAHCSSGCSTRPRISSAASTHPSRFTRKDAIFRSGAEGIRTLGLHRARMARHFVGPFRCLQNGCKSAYFVLNAFPRFSGDLLGLLHGWCTRRRPPPRCIVACKQRNYATWASMLQLCPNTCPTTRQRIPIHPYNRW